MEGRHNVLTSQRLKLMYRCERTRPRAPPPALNPEDAPPPLPPSSPQAALQGVGRDPASVSREAVRLMCKNARNLRVVRWEGGQDGWGGGRSRKRVTRGVPQHTECREDRGDGGGGVGQDEREHVWGSCRSQGH